MGVNNKKRLGLPEIGKFIDPLTDFGFKHLFGREPSKELLIHFLNELFKGRKIIKTSHTIGMNVQVPEPALVQ